MAHQVEQSESQGAKNSHTQQTKKALPGKRVHNEKQGPDKTPTRGASLQGPQG